MTLITEPLLACNRTPDLNKIEYPILLSAKLDGIRCLVIDGHPLSRTFKNIPNRFIYETLSALELPDGLDGELLTYTDGKLDSYNDVQSKVMSEEGEPEFIFHIFDAVASSLNEVFAVRYFNLLTWYNRFLNQYSEAELVNMPKPIRIVFQVECKNRSEVEANEAHWIANGFEGVMLRDPQGRYKCGRSTMREGILLKLKRFADGEATIIGMTELMHNENGDDKDNFGKMKRSKSQAYLVPSNKMGNLKVRDLVTKVEFEIGTGFTDKQRQYYWHNRELVVMQGTVVKFKHQPHGAKDKPRCPVFLSERNIIID